MDETSGPVGTGTEVRYLPTPTVVAWGELDVATVPGLEHALARLLESDGTGTIEIDLNGVTFIDSSGLGVLVAALKQSHGLGGQLVVRGLQPAPRKVFEVTGLLDLFQAS
ncbi:MAG: STAS domain-containing protein [Acidimicrobiia bacterium]